MNNWTLRLRIEDTDENAGRLACEFVAEEFRGRASAYFDLKDLAAKAVAFAEFPLDPERCPAIRGGYWSATQAKELVQEHVGLVATPRSRAGAITIDVRLAVPSEDSSAGSQRCDLTATASLVASYAHLSALSDGLVRLANGEIEELELASS